ncbi:MAG: hypothetical protein J6K12_03325 [Clostridia bacterium]|nr:hypothetical protein [Clostridia bacterium]
MKKSRMIAVVGAVCLAVGASFAAGKVMASTDTDPLITLSYLEQVALPKLKTEVLAEMNGSSNTSVEKSGNYAVIELNKGQNVYAESALEIIVRPGSNVACVSDFDDQGIADITLGKEIMNGEQIAINSYCIIPRGDDGRGFTVVSDKAYVMIRGDYRIG